MILREYNKRGRKEEELEKSTLKNPGVWDRLKEKLSVSEYSRKRAGISS